MDNQVNNIAELLQKIPPIFTGKEKDSVQMKNVAHLKRAVEYYLYDPDFRKKFDNDADGTLKNYAIEASAKDVEILVNARLLKKSAVILKKYRLRFGSTILFLLKNCNGVIILSLSDVFQKIRLLKNGVSGRLIEAGESLTEKIQVLFMCRWFLNYR